MKQLLKEFQEFAMRGSVIDLAIGVIIGSAFGKITSSLVTDILMPPIGLLLGRINFSSMFFSLNGQVYESLKVAQEAGAPTINYGLFINNLIDFIIIAFVLFLILKPINNLRAKPPAPPAVPTEKDCPYCFSKIDIRATRCSKCTAELKQTS